MLWKELLLIKWEFIIDLFEILLINIRFSNLFADAVK